MNFNLKLNVLVAVLLFGTMLASASGGGSTPQIVQKLGDICENFVKIVPVVALLMFIVGGAIYAAGQIMGAETRARANVWATAMLVGGIIGLILAASAPFFIKTFAKFALGTTATSAGTYETGTSVDDALRECGLTV